MKSTLVLSLFLLTGCTLFNKNVGGNDLQEMTKDVIEEGRGVSIDITPIE